MNNLLIQHHSVLIRYAENEGTMVYTRNKSIEKESTNGKPITAILQNHEDKKESTAKATLHM
jgi:hypothetical protein